MEPQIKVGEDSGCQFFTVGKSLDDASQCTRLAKAFFVNFLQQSAEFLSPPLHLQPVLRIVFHLPLALNIFMWYSRLKDRDPKMLVACCPCPACSCKEASDPINNSGISSLGRFLWLNIACSACVCCRTCPARSPH